MMNVLKKHALVIILAPYVWILFALVLFVWGPPLYASAEYWIPEVYAIKDRYARTLDSPKVIVLAGSNALFGLYSPLLAERTARPVLNLSTHAGLPLPYLRSLLERYARPGDIVVLPLEYEYYARDEQWATGPWTCSQFSTWARADISCFTWTERGRLLYHILPGYPARLRKLTKRIPLRPAEEVIRLATQHTAILSDMPYHAEGATPQGEFLVDEDTASIIREGAARGFSYLGDAPLSDYAARNLEALAEYARQSDLTLFFTYPVSIRNPLYDLTRKEDRLRLALLNQSVVWRGEWIGEPEFFNMDVRYFFDTNYHLNAEGSLLRTLYLADALNVRLRGESIPWLTMGKDGYEAARRQEARALLERIRTRDVEGRGSPQALW